jgi:hypothetical protein
MILLSCSGQQFSLPPEAKSFAVQAAYNNKVDIIIISDRSQTMEKYRQRLASEVPAMLAKLDSRGIDYHIAVISMDMSSSGDGGRFLGSPRYLTRFTPNLGSLLQSRIRESRLSSPIERGLDSLKAVLQPSYLSGDGSGFLRDDALLAILAISDEDDYGVSAPSVYMEHLNALKPPTVSGGQPNWIYNFIGVLSLTGNCATIEDFIDVGIKHLALVKASKGIAASICDSTLKEAVENIDKRLIEILSEQFLSRRPVVSTLRVLVNSNEVPRSTLNGWEYFADTNSIRFFGNYQPNPNDVVTVNFTPAEGL